LLLQVAHQLFSWVVQDQEEVEEVEEVEGLVGR
jgi:hypothetical protein